MLSGPERTVADREIIPDLALRWLDEGRRFAVAILIETDGSAPLPVGSAMLIDESGRIEGSVSGGCVEGDLAQQALRALEGDQAAVHEYGISDELAGTVGLMCGGRIRVLVAPLSARARPPLEALSQACDAERPASLLIAVSGPEAGTLAFTNETGVLIGDLGDPRLGEAAARDAAAMLGRAIPQLRHYGADGTRMAADRAVFNLPYAPAARMVIVGAVDFSVALARIAPHLGYRVTICDPREPFLSRQRMAPAELVAEWPDRYIDSLELGERDAVLIFSHDPKFDEPAALAALRSGVGYIGALGSRRTAADRRRRLREAGVDEADLQRIVSPCGLDIGSAGPGETAIAILAEIAMLRNGRDGGRLIEGEGSIRSPGPGERAGATALPPARSGSGSEAA